MLSRTRDFNFINYCSSNYLINFILFVKLLLFIFFDPLFTSLISTDFSFCVHVLVLASIPGVIFHRTPTIPMPPKHIVPSIPNLRILIDASYFLAPITTVTGRSPNNLRSHFGHRMIFSIRINHITVD